MDYLKRLNRFFVGSNYDFQSGSFRVSFTVKKVKEKKLIVIFLAIISLFSCKTYKNLETSTNKNNNVFSNNEEFLNFPEYQYETNLTLYKDLFYSKGDTAILYYYDHFSVDGGMDYISLDTSIWIDYKIIEIYR